MFCAENLSRRLRRRGRQINPTSIPTMRPPAMPPAIPPIAPDDKPDFASPELEAPVAVGTDAVALGDIFDVPCPAPVVVMAAF